jgi:MinD-like ATPase involved in chromosome partitioning or flagellar assembly
MELAELALPPITWVDVARRFSGVTVRGFRDDQSLAAPVGVLGTEVFWSGVTITIADQARQESALSWLRALFPSRIDWNAELGEGSIKLDAPASLDRLPITFEAEENQRQLPHVFRPSATLEGRHSFRVSVPERPADALPLFAFHSVKGGVGRTTAAITMARHLTRELKKPILLVDADFEAPGISYLLTGRKPEISISLEDVIVLAHADPRDDLKDTLDFVAYRLQEQRVDDLFVLPVKRSTASLSWFAIKPEHIVAARSGRPFLIVDMLRAIAERVGSAGVVVDLRSGLVEIAMQVLTDPSVERIFVTTTSGQPLDATCDMVRALGDVERLTGVAGRKPLMVVNQIPTFMMADRRFLDKVTGDIEAAAIDAFQSTAEHAAAEAVNDQKEHSEVEYGSDSPLSFAVLPHSSDLVRMPNNWDAFVSQLDSTGFSQALVNQARSWAGFDALLHDEADKGKAPAAVTTSAGTERKAACLLLGKTAQSMIVAETAVGALSTPLVTPPLQRLGEDFQRQPPIAVVEGAKGTGKTLIFRFLMEQQTWRRAVANLDDKLAPDILGPVIPVCGSSYSERMVALIGERNQEIAQAYGAGSAMPFSEIRGRIQEQLGQTRSEVQWADFWLDTIAWASGVGVGTEGAWQDFLKRTRDRNERPVALFEGLEEVITDPYTDPRQATALRALIVDVPLRLRQEAGRPVGLLVFVRGDMVEGVIRQNLAQFRAGYRNYALTWSSNDILELVVWLVSNSKAIPNLWTRAWRDQDNTGELERIWGWKLGPPKSREARSTEWVLAVLTDLNGRLTARDLVRFIAVAAQLSGDEQPGDNRLLAPMAMRRAVASTSEEKVKEYPSEVSVLQPIFDKLHKIKGLETPLDLQTAYAVGLDDSELGNLVKYGVFFEEAGLYEVPELFRIGLGLTRKGARPNIISLTRRALERARAGGTT